MNYRGFYINLDRSPERRTKVEAQLERVGLRESYHRFRASDGNSEGFPNPYLGEGKIGCFTSHYQLLKQELESRDHLHVIEDDIVLSHKSKEIFSWVIESGKLDWCDILYTEVTVPLRSDAYKMYKRMYDQAVHYTSGGTLDKISFSTYNMKDMVCASTGSFFVNQGSIKKLYQLFKKELEGGATIPVDLFLQRLCAEEKIKIGLLFPFVTSLDLDSALKSDVAAEPNYRNLVAGLLARHSLYIERDLARCQEYFEMYLTKPDEADRHAKLLTDILSFSLTDDYKPF